MVLPSAPPLAVAALFATERDLIKDFSTFGLIFESLCTRDLKVYTQHLGGEVMYYRDSSGLECDNIIHLRDGRWAAIEVKLGSIDRIEEGARNLTNLERKINTEKVGRPIFKMILTATEHAYRRDDGIFVVPICLVAVFLFLAPASRNGKTPAFFLQDGSRGKSKNKASAALARSAKRRHSAPGNRGCG